MYEKVVGNVKGILNNVTIADFILSILFLVSGLVFFTNKDMNTLIVAIIYGIMIICTGIVRIYSYLKKDNVDLFNYNLILGIIIIIVGIVTFILSKYLNYVIAVFLIIIGIEKMIYGIILKKFSESSWLLTIVIGLIFIVLGVITFFTSKDAIVTVSGIDALGYSLINIIFISLLRKRSKYFLA